MADQKIALVIDDDPAIVDSIKDVLKRELHYLVLPATEPQTAVDLAQNYLFDLLVLDLHMPKLDGFQVLELVRKKQPRIKVVVITGFYDQYKDRFQSVRVDKILEKPIEPPALKKEVLAVAGSADFAPPKPEASPGPFPNARILIVDDDPAFCEAFRECLEGDEPNRYRVETALSGAEGIRLCGEFNPDMLLFDVNMPVMNGREMMEAVRRGGGAQPKFCLALTADSYDPELPNLKRLDCPVMFKPFRPEKMLELLREKSLELGLCSETP